jgi:hypothetical protein
VVSDKENNMRRILLTLAVALFSVAAPDSPASASTVVHKQVHPKLPSLSPRALALETLQDHRQLLEFQAHAGLNGVASRFHLTLQQIVAKWQRVAICEVNGNWSMKGPMYSGIGFANTTWTHFGGGRFAASAGDASRVEQVLIGMKVTKTWIPDQYGCSPSGW